MLNVAVELEFFDYAAHGSSSSLVGTFDFCPFDQGSLSVFILLTCFLADYFVFPILPRKSSRSSKSFKLESFFLLSAIGGSITYFLNLSGEMRASMSSSII